MERFQAIRDSIQKAHKGQLSDDELRQEMRKVFAGRMSQAGTESSRTPIVAPVPKAANKFGITSRFPEYQKSAYNPSHQSGRGRVWILKANGLLEAISVRTGLNDGRYTEITSMKLKPGDQIVLGASSGDTGTTTAPNPLAGQQQRGPGGGGFR